MSDNKNLSPEIIKSQFQVALNKSSLGLQALHDAASKLIFNEDNLEDISKYLEKCRKAKKVVEAEHAALKRPALTECQMYDESKKQMEANINSIYSTVHEKYTKMCNEIENRKLAKFREERRIDGIKKGIEENLLSFSKKIAECTTSKQLTEIESLINLEKTRTQKYQEFVSLAKERYSTLASLLAKQKDKVKELENLERQKKALEKANDGDEVSMLDLESKIDEQKSAIEETKIEIEEHAIDSAINVGSDVETAEEITPEVKARRTTWKWRVKDIKELQKKMPHLVKLVADEEKIDEWLKSKKTDGSLKDQESVIVNGIEFYVFKSY